MTPTERLLTILRLVNNAELHGTLANAETIRADMPTRGSRRRHAGGRGRRAEAAIHLHHRRFRADGLA